MKICPVCGKKIEGRIDKIYCTPTSSIYTQNFPLANWIWSVNLHDAEEPLDSNWHFQYHSMQQKFSMSQV